MENNNYESNLTDRVLLCPDGKYRWTYEVNLWKKPTIFLDLLKAFLIPLLLIMVIGVSVGFHRYGFEWETLVEEAKGMFWVCVFVLFLCLIGYVLFAKINGGRYAAMFVMDEGTVTHYQMQKHVERSQLIAAINIMLDAQSSGPAVLAAAVSSWESNFSKVRRVKAIRRRNLIKVNGILTKNRIFVENSEDYEFVLRYITERCPKLKQNEQNNQPKKTTT